MTHQCPLKVIHASLLSSITEPVAAADGSPASGCALFVLLLIVTSPRRCAGCYGACRLRFLAVFLRISSSLCGMRRKCEQCRIAFMLLSSSRMSMSSATWIEFHWCSRLPFAVGVPSGRFQFWSLCRAITIQFSEGRVRIRVSIWRSAARPR